jgi:hypothetical protein
MPIEGISQYLMIGREPSFFTLASDIQREPPDTRTIQSGFLNSIVVADVKDLGAFGSQTRQLCSGRVRLGYSQDGLRLRIAQSQEKGHTSRTPCPGQLGGYQLVS